MLWARLLASQFGVSIFGVIVATAAFMAGLGVGAVAGARWIERPRLAPLTVFGLLETGVALYALLVPVLALSLGQGLDALAPRLTLDQWFAVQAAACFALFAIPACAMGFAFTRVLAAAPERPHAVGQLYGLNTLGAAFGALVPLWTLPSYGWAASARGVALVGLSIGIAALWIGRRAAARLEPSGRADGALLEAHGDDRAATPDPRSSRTRPPLRTLIVYAGIGAAALVLEIGWTRLYGMVLLRTEYVLAMVLAVYLLGLAVGSLIAERLGQRAMAWILPLLAAAGVLQSLFALPALSARLETARFTSLGQAIAVQALALAALTLPVTLVLGAWLPILSRRWGGRQSGAWLYGFNCAGAALGSIAAGAVLIPLVGTAAAVALAGLALLGLGLTFSPSRRAWLVFPIAALAAIPAGRFPPVERLLPQALGNARTLFRYEDAVALNHVVQEESGQRILLTDLQRMDASTEPSAVRIQADQARLALLLHPAPRSVLFLGLGTGISAAGSLPFPDLDRTAVELSAGAILAAGAWFDASNEHVIGRLHVIHDDARHFLEATDRKYDVIVGDLFHPDLAGAGALLSVEQFARARARLADDGVFVQWLALNQFDARSLQVELRSFRHVFPQAELYVDALHAALVGRSRPAQDRVAMGANLQRMSADEQQAATGGEGMWTWLSRYCGTIPDSTGPLQREWLPYIEFRLPKARYAGAIDMDRLLEGLLQQRPALQDAASALGVPDAERDAFSSAYEAQSLATRAWIAALRGDAAEEARLYRAAFRTNERDRWIAHAVADDLLAALPQLRRFGLDERTALERILRMSPDHVETLRALWHLEGAAGHPREAEQYRSRLLIVAPLDAQARQAVPRS